MNAIEARGIWKAFDGNFALRDAHLAVASGTIHALIGENGAGKSTLIRALTGVHRPDLGEILIGGRPVSLAGVHDAMRHGVSAVHQERNLVPEISIAENLLLHKPPRRAGLLDYQRMYDDAEPWLARVGLDVDPRRPASLLSVAQGQLLEIARALSVRSNVLLLDEPTASITERESAVLFEILRELRDEGTAILFVSHKLEELMGLCDRITVLRDGQTVVDGAEVDGLGRADLITAMVGRSVAFAQRREPCARPETPMLELRDVSTDLGHENVSLRLEAGGVVGLYGLVGAGRTELARCIVGLGRVLGGEMLLRGEAIHVSDPHDALQRHRIGYVSEDRKGEGLILSHSIGNNVGITVWDRLRRAMGFITPRREAEVVGPVVERIGVRMAGLEQEVGQLSGGNQQKVCFARWIAGDVDLLVVDEPTVGVDVRTKEEMYVLLDELARAGKAILLISSDLAEVVRLADRILVMADRRIIAEHVNTGDYTELSSTIMSEIIASQASSAPERAAS